MSHQNPRRLVGIAAVALALLAAGCRASIRADSVPPRAAPAEVKDRSSSPIDFAVLQSGYTRLLNAAVESPTSDSLLNAAWDGLIDEAGREGVTARGASRPVFVGDAKADFTAFADAFAALTAEHGGKLDGVRLNYAATDRMAASLDDSHTTFVPPDAAVRQNQRDAGNLGTSTGMRMERRTDQPPVVLEVVPDSAAEHAGVRPGDAVLAINGRRIETMTPREAGRSLEGNDGTKLRLDLRRPGYARVKQVTIVRRTISLDLVRSRTLPGNVGYIRIREFPVQVPIQLQVQQALDDFAAEKTNGVVVDLRGNPGGSLLVLQAVLSQFVSQSPLVLTVSRTGRQQAIPRNGPFDFRQRLVVLIDDGSASSAEIFAAAVKEYGDGLIVGARTCGCLMGSQFFDLADHQAKLQIAVEGILSPVQKQSLEKNGLMPDAAVPADVRALGDGRDPQLEAGLVSLGVDTATAASAKPATQAQ